MIIYQAIDGPDVIAEFFNKFGERMKLNVLMSYVYTGKATISITEYLAYIRRYGHLFTTVFTLDDNFENPQHNLENQNYLEQGLQDKDWKPVPCIHDADDSMGEIQTYVDQGHSYIALGSTGDHGKILDEAYVKFPGVRFHLFGTLDRNILFKYKPFSADASSWAKEAGQGSIYYWDEIDQKEYNIDIESRIKKGAKSSGKNVLYSDFHHKMQLEEFLMNTFGYTHQTLLNVSLSRQIVNLYHLHQLQERINATPVT
jgi:hypothetical protein